jgi:NAD(P)-dependent dehydrogenase (short-subunit alcohol dehydrogenase family)
MTSGDGDRALLSDPPTLRLDGRVAWVTGASRGLGRAIAFALAGAGADVMVTARSPAPLQSVVEAIRAQGGQAHLTEGSVADPATITRTVSAIDATWGRLDVLVNNAGISPVFRPAEHVDDDTWREVMEVNLRAPFACARSALPLLEAGGSASVVNVSSIHAVSAHERLVAYAASKGGLEMVTRTLAIEWADRGVRVNSVAPAYSWTDMSSGLLDHEHWAAQLRSRTPMGRFASTAEIAACVLFLAGPASSYVTGTTLFADGGWNAR